MATIVETGIRDVVVSVPAMYGSPVRLIEPDEKAHARSSLGTIVSTWRHALLRPTPSTARKVSHRADPRKRLPRRSRRWPPLPGPVRGG